MMRRASREESDDPRTTHGFTPTTGGLSFAGSRSLSVAARWSIDPRTDWLLLLPAAAAELSTVLKDEPERGSGAAHPPLLVRHQGKKTAAGCAPLLRGSTSRSWKEILWGFFFFFPSLKSKVVR